jgi:hypothetical protein
MSKKHFIALADAIREYLPERLECASQDYPQRNEQGYQVAPIALLTPALAQEIVIDILADFCKAQNRNFDRARWLGYIAGENGPNGGKVKRA